MSSSRTKNKKPHGQVRQSQVVTTFGPGSMFDLPNHSVIVGGLEYWTKGRRGPRAPAGRQAQGLAPDSEPRAPRSAARQRRPDLDPEDGHHLLAVPRVVHHPGSAGHGSRALDPLAPADPPVVADRRASSSTTTRRRSRSSRSASCGPAARGTSATSTGTTSSTTERPRCRRDLWIDERGTSGDLSEVWVRCECKAERQMIEATKPEMHALGHCDGWQPWLGPRASGAVRRAEPAADPHGEQRLLPADDERHLAARPGRGRGQGGRSGLGALPAVRRRPRRPDQGAQAEAPVAAALEGFADEDVFAEIQSRKQGTTPGSTSRSSRPSSRRW